MSTYSLQYRPSLLTTCSHGQKTPQNKHKIHSIWIMTAYLYSSTTKQKWDGSIKFPNTTSLVPSPCKVVSPLDLRFDRLQPQDHQAFVQENRLEFGQFLARRAQVDEEYWTAAWLRAESHWEDRGDDRFADSYKRKFAEQEFNAIKRRSRALLGNKCSCIVAVEKDCENQVKCNVIKSIVGTLDLNIQDFSRDEAFSGVNRETSSRYGYVANLCVAKSARRQGIASNMIYFSIESARLDGAEKVFVHVQKHNKAAQDLYHKIGFKVVEAASLKESAEQIFFLCFE